jgi:pimeloyl-ACP methyl ester carboxylesterase
MLYHPTPKVKSEFKTIKFKDGNLTINAYVINEDKKDAIIVFGGNNDSIADVAKVFAKVFKNYAIYLLDYRGYGLSQGKPSQEAIFKDAIKLYDYVSKRHKNINIIGRSLGTSVASYVASKRSVNKLVLVTPFDSILNIAKERYFFLPVGLLLKDKYETINFVKNINAKTLILVATNDKIVSQKRSENLIKHFKKQGKDFKVVKFNSGHNDIVEDKNYFKVIKEFLDS